MAEGIKFESLSGSPQGGIISLLLVNVYLHYVGLKMEELIKEGKPVNKSNQIKTIVRGIIRYFCFANNLDVLTHLNYLAEYSCLKTLARKRETAIARVRKKLNIGSTWGLIKEKPNTNYGRFFSWGNVVRIATKQPNFKFIILGQFAIHIAKGS
ncbi:MAG: group II intron reverse transcriptase/maturase ['Waltheria sp.' little leaf phytoplasma]|nr:group II intron reverse transcriptase/maturase ['Waltheria sp.' little leaf phytoplasma]